jgi:hypothetical protein
MGTISKAIAAGGAGAVAGVGLGAGMLPDNSPWYAYVIMVAVTTILPALVTYLAPKNN